MATTTERIRRVLTRLRDDPRLESEALVRRVAWQLLKPLTPIVAVDREGHRILVSTRDDVIGRRLFAYPSRQELDIEWAFQALRSIPAVADALHDYTVVEIGANIGSHTVDMLRTRGAQRVVAIEPDPDNCRLLRHNLLENGVADRVQTLELALSEQPGVVQLELSSFNTGDHRVRVAAAASGDPEADRRTIDVRAASLDSLADAGEIDFGNVDLVWMDAQGHEGHILRGGSKLLASSIPVVTEYWPYGLRRAGGLDTFHELIAANYSHFIDLNSPAADGRARVLPAYSLPALEAEYGWSGEEGSTDLVLSRQIVA
jgi:FkbM family methyltransferase